VKAPEDEADDFAASSPSPASFPLAILRLLRLPNVFTAWADVFLGYWLAQLHGAYGEPRTLVLLIAASSGIYWAGMVWNDLFDLEVDRRERPERPLPSGAVPLRIAQLMGALLLAGGVVAAALTGTIGAIVAIALGFMAVAYDAGLKRTPLGPLAMGLCRALNILLGLSPALATLLSRPPFQLPLVEISPTAALPVAADGPWFLIPVGALLYVAGITILSRGEAETSRRSALSLGAAVLFSGFAVHGWVCFHKIGLDPGVWQIGAVLMMLLVFRTAHAIASPTPRLVQRAVVTAILGIIAIDAILLLAFQTRTHALWTMALWPVSMVLGRWLYST